MPGYLMRKARSTTTIDGQDCRNITETQIIKRKRSIHSVCPCIGVFPELADDWTECLAV